MPLLRSPPPSPGPTSPSPPSTAKAVSSVFCPLATCAPAGTAFIVSSSVRLPLPPSLPPPFSPHQLNNAVPLGLGPIAATSSTIPIQPVFPHCSTCASRAAFLRLFHSVSAFLTALRSRAIWRKETAVVGERRVPPPVSQQARRAVLEWVEFGSVGEGLESGIGLLGCESIL